MSPFTAGVGQSNDNDRAPRADGRPPAAPLAEIAHDGPPNKAYSPIVLVGFVRPVEFGLLAGVGFAVHEFYLAPVLGHDAVYTSVILGMAALAVVSLQTFGLYTVSAFRAPARRGLMVLGGWSAVFVCALAMVFFLSSTTTFRGFGSPAGFSSGSPR